MKKEKKPFWEMNTDELREATREFDKETTRVPGKPLTPADRRLFARARQKALKRAKSQPEVKTEEVRITLERKLLREADAAAKKLHVTRAELIERGLRNVLQKAG